MHLQSVLLITGIVVLTFSANFVNSGRAPPPVTIRKCCRIGEQLIEETQKCIAGATEKWVPVIFLLAKKTTFMPVGEAPKHFTIIESSRPDICTDYQLFKGASNIAIFSNGSLFLKQNALTVPPEHFCVDKGTALVCLPNQPKDMDFLTAPKKLSNVHKCCGPMAVYSQLNSTCQILDKDHHLAHTDVINSSIVDVLYGFPECHMNHYAISGKFKIENFQEESGSLILDSGKQYKSTEFCLEHTVTSTDGLESYVSVFTCPENFSLQSKPAPVPQHKDVRFALYSIGLFISVVFLFATLAAGFLVPSNHHVLHWRCQTHYVACLLVGDLLLAITQISGNSIAGPACFVMAIFMHFFFLAAFFWLNTMCFNIWWTFRDFRPTSLEKGQELCRLRIYEVYAWGVPLVISGVAAILDSLPENPNDTFLRPRFGEARCWFHGDLEILTYFFGPIGVLLIINLLLFASTARQLTCGLWKRDDVKSTTERAALGRVCLKLVVVMGVTWIADVLSWVIGGPNYVWYVTDLINALQGVFIFIVVGCQPQVWAAMKRIWSSKTGRSMMNTTNGPQHSSSSHGLPSMGESVTNNTFTNNTSTKVPMETVC